MKDYVVWVKWNYAEGSGEPYNVKYEEGYASAAKVAGVTHLALRPRATNWSWMKDATLYIRVRPIEHAADAYPCVKEKYFRGVETTKGNIEVIEIFNERYGDEQEEETV